MALPPSHTRSRGTASQAVVPGLHRFGALAALCLAAGAWAQPQPQPLPDFDRQLLDADFEGGYGVGFADVDGDGRPDIIAWATNPGRIAWYRNPDWDKHPVATSLGGIVDSAPHDIDGDGDVDLALAHDFSLGDSTGGGVLHWLENPGDPTANQQWNAHYIDEIATSHRLLWADVNGDGKLELVNLPIVGVGAEAPLYAGTLQLKSYPVPEDLAAPGWSGVVLDHSLELAPGMASLDWDGDGRDDLLTASRGGVHLFQLAVNGRMVAKTLVGAGAPGIDTAARDGELSRLGSSEVAAGVLPGGRRFVAAIEPWHGNQVVVYQGDERPQPETALPHFRDGNQVVVYQDDELPMNRLVIDDRIAEGHGLATADLNNDGVDEIIAGGRAEPYQLAVHQYDENGGRWRHHSLDTETAVSGLAAADVDGDGDIDLAAIGPATRALVLYRNLGVCAVGIHGCKSAITAPLADQFR